MSNFSMAPKTQRLNAWLNGQAFEPGEILGWGLHTPLDRIWWNRLYDFFYSQGTGMQLEPFDVGGIELVMSYHTRGPDSFLPGQIGNWFGRTDKSWSVLIGQERIMSRETPEIALYNRVVGVEVKGAVKAFERDWLVLMMATT